MIRKIYDRLASLIFGLWLIGGVCILLAAGSFSGGGAEGSSINDLPLFRWLAETPLSLSWWLWGAIGLLVLLALNTVLCSIESVRTKYRRGNFLVLIAPQVMHAGFLLIVLAHLASARGGYKQVMPIQEGGVITCPDGTRLQIANLTASMGPMGFPMDYSAEIRTVTGGREESATISPNHPYFHKGSGFYLKEVALEPYRAALIEIHREPGAGVALAGALLFTAGNVVLLYVRRGKRLTTPDESAAS